MSLNAAKLEDFKAKSANGSSNLRKLQTKVGKCLTKVPLTYSPDGALKFGDSIMLGNLSSGSVLVCDPFIDNIPGMGIFKVAAAAEANEPVARNTYTIMRPPKYLKNFADDDSDPVLRIGQAFCLSCNENLLVSSDSKLLEPQLYLSSTKKTERTSTKSTNRQMVYMSTSQGADSIWTLSPPSRGKIGSSERFLSIGSPVFIGDAYMLVHRQTNSNLTVDIKNNEMSEFGVEYECYCDRTSSFGKVGMIVAEFAGQCTGESMAKPDAVSYYWSLVTAASETPSSELRPELPPPASIDTLLQEIRRVANEKGAEGFSALRLLFVVLDSKSRINDGKLDREDIKECLNKWGFDMDDRYLEILLSSHDPSRSGIINYREFLDFLRGELSTERMQVLDRVIDALEGVGAMSPEAFQKFFDATAHPLVYGGVCSERNLRQYFMDSLRFREKLPTTISTIAFCDFFCDVCIGENDAVFEKLLFEMFAVALADSGVREGKLGQNDGNHK